MATNKLIVITAPCASSNIAPAQADQIFEAIARAVGCSIDEVCFAVIDGETQSGAFLTPPLRDGPTLNLSVE